MDKKERKKKHRIFDFFWTLEEQNTILGLLKGRKNEERIEGTPEGKRGKKCLIV